MSNLIQCPNCGSVAEIRGDEMGCITCGLEMKIRESTKRYTLMGKYHFSSQKSELVAALEAAKKDAYYGVGSILILGQYVPKSVLQDAYSLLGKGVKPYNPKSHFTVALRELRNSPKWEYADWKDCAAELGRALGFGKPTFSTYKKSVDCGCACGANCAHFGEEEFISAKFKNFKTTNEWVNL